MNIGIATMTRCPDHLVDWIRYHLKMGISKIFLRLEGNHVMDTMKHLEAFPDVVVLETELYPVGDQMVRQIFLVQAAIESARQYSLDFLLHIDDDELLHLNPSLSLQQLIQMMNHDDQYDFFHLNNAEAVYPQEREEVSCFQRTRWFRDCARSECRSYGNGKSMARITDSTEPDGVHYFKGRRRQIPMDMARILHFESCDFQSWKQKFSVLPPSKFNFYRQSHDAVQKALACGESCDHDLYRAYLLLTGGRPNDQLLELPLS